MVEAPEKQINEEFLSGLELVSNKIFPLPGATFDHPGQVDSRLKLAMPLLAGSKITYFEHIATVRHPQSGRFFVAFRQTKDAQLLEQQDPEKYPEWLMKDPVKDTELKTYIYAVKQENHQPLVPSRMRHLTSHEDWLEHIGNGPLWLFDTLAYFLVAHRIITQSMYGKLR